MDNNDMKKYIAEMFGTMVLTLFGCGVAVFVGLGAGLAFDYSGWVVAVSLAFGLSIVALAYAIGSVSGCHINPAISLGMFIDGRIDKKDLIFYLVFQFIGGIIGAAILFFLVTATGNGTGTVAGLGQNGFDTASATGISLAGALVIEIILTMVFVLAALGVTSKQSNTPAQAGIVIGLTLTFVHLMGIPFTGTSVNPARSFGPALMMAFSDVSNNTLALEQVWVFIVAPLIGAVIAGLLWKYVFKTETA